MRSAILSLFVCLCFYGYPQPEPGLKKFLSAFKIERLDQGNFQLRPAGQATACVKDSTWYSDWDPAQLTFTVAFKSIYGYNQKLQLSSEHSYNRNSGPWHVTGRTSYYYNSHDSLGSRLYEMNQGANAWVNSSMTSYAYNSAKMLTESLQQSWNTISGAWENSGKYTVTYNSAGKISSEMQQYWSQSSSAWRNSALYSYTYTGNNMTKEIDQEWITSTNAWRNQARYTYSYDIFNNLVGGLLEGWNTTSNTWENAAKLAVVYSGSNNSVVTATLQFWDPGPNAWENDTRITTVSDNDQKTVSELFESWNNGWVNGSRTMYTYDAKGNLLATTSEQWNTGSASWEKDANTSNFYNCTTVGIVENSIKDGSPVYPNPVTSTLYVQAGEDPQHISIYDSRGCLVAETMGKSIGVEHLPKGIYFLRVSDGAGNILKNCKVIRE